MQNEVIEPQDDQASAPEQAPTNWQFTPDTPSNQPATPAPQQPIATEVEWSASEFVAHHKSFGWYLLAVVAAVLVGFVIFIFTRDYFSAGLTFLAVLMLVFFASRRPRTLTYRLDAQGVTIGSKMYPYGDFRSFYMVNEGPLTSITFVPLRRFMLPITVYYDPKDEKVPNTISAHLPFEEGEHDAVDNFMRRIRF